MPEDTPVGVVKEEASEAKKSSASSSASSKDDEKEAELNKSPDSVGDKTTVSHLDFHCLCLLFVFSNLFHNLHELQLVKLC